jgi:DUF971 family protein
MNLPKKRPAEIGLSDTELAIRWQDGSESRYSLEELRRNCPCAQCRALREEPGVQAPPAPGPLELPMLSDTAATATARAAGWELVGRYGLRLTWADGHDHGIYTFEYLREQG